MFVECATAEEFLAKVNRDYGTEFTTRNAACLCEIYAISRRLRYTVRELRLAEARMNCEEKTE